MARSSRSTRARHRAKYIRLRDEKRRQNKEYQPTFVVEDVDIGPESTCECCENNAAVGTLNEEAFDENGYPKIRKNMLGTEVNPSAQLPPPGFDHNPVDDDTFVEQGSPIIKKSLLSIKPSAQPQASHMKHRVLSLTSISSSKEPPKPFRLLDLPAELRNRIYEFVIGHETQPVCVNDILLRPVTSSKRGQQQHMRSRLLHCTSDLVCVPCQLHAAIGTGCFALSSANKQLHSETTLITYKVNHFSLHNLYYLQAFLTIIGKDARQSVKSLRFDWKLPEDEVHATKTYANCKATYRLLLSCKLLTTLWVDMDVVNLLSWCEDGNRSEVVMHDIRDTRAIDLMYNLRGLREIRVRWKHVPGLQMEAWVKAVMGVWRLPRGRPASDSTPVDVKTTMEEDLWCCVFWKAGEPE